MEKLKTKREKRPRRPQDDDDDDESSPSQSMRLSQINIEDINNASVHECKAGIIQRIHVRNFMCHDSMEINFNPQINFVVGRNGSGKSAILMALVVGLGGKASTTNRGSALKEFVKKGERTAVIEITINNSGPLGYKKQLYGDRITVVRTLSNGPGPTGYKIKSATGNIMSTKFEDLKQITAALKIQVDNPVSVLNQDTSRTFLNSSDPADKYSLFMRATQLDEINTNHARSLEFRGEAVNSLHTKKSALTKIKKNVDELEKQWNQLKSVPDQKRKIEALENELLWAHVIAKERLQAEAEGKQAELEATLRQLQERTDNEADREAKLQDLIRQVQDQLAEQRVEGVELEQRFTEAKAKYRRSKEAHISKVRELKAAAGKVQRQASEVDAYCVEIEKLKRETGEGARRREEAVLKLAQANERRAVARDTLHTCSHHYNQLLAAEEPVRGELGRARAHVQELADKIMRLNNKLQGMERNTSSSLSVYGADIPALVAAIEAAHRRGKFHKMPVGPLGAHMKLRDASWVPVVEQLVGPNFLRSFLVDNQHDQVELFTLIKRVFTNQAGAPDVLRCKFLDRVHDTSRAAVVSNEYTSALDAIIFSSPMVANAAIDYHSLETTLLVASDDDAMGITSDRQYVPRNLRKVITKTGATFFPAPNYKSYSGHAHYRAKFLQVSTQDVIRELQGELAAQTREKELAAKTYVGLTENLREMEARTRTEKKELDKLVRLEHALAAEIATHEAAVEPEENCVAELIVELEEKELQLAESKEQQESIAVEAVALKQRMEQDREATTELCNEAQAANTREQPLLSSMEGFRSELRACIKDKHFAVDKVRAAELTVVSAMRKTQQCTQEAEALAQDASKLCARISTRRRPDRIEEDKRTLEARLAETERTKGSYLEITEMYQEAKAKYEVVAKVIEELDKVIKFMDTQIQLRSRIYSKNQSNITLQVVLYFKYRLNQRQYTGDLNVDHKRKQLCIEVSPAHRGNADETVSSKDTRTLSGGERSYSTVMFIMALWDSITLPFYFMDEFDVFMDKVNRRVVMDMLLAHAKENQGRQFVFLTPQDTSSIPVDDVVTIYRMEDPRN